MKKIVAISFVALLVSLSTQAIPIIYTFSGTGTGFVGSTPFDKAAFTIRAVADTNGVVTKSNNIFMVNVSSTTIDISGFPAMQFTAGQRLFVAQDSSVLGFSKSELRNGDDLLNLSNAAFANYDLRFAFGPVFDADPFAVTQIANEPSTLGNVTFSSATNVTFTAAITPYDAWKQKYFSMQQHAQPGVSGDLADPDKDGIPNLLEYASNLDPWTWTANTGSQLQLVNNFTQIKFTYRKNKSATDVVFSLQEKIDLAGASWALAQGTSQSVESDDGETQIIAILIPTAGSWKYFHLLISLQQ